jgi:hypothetical protein
MTEDGLKSDPASPSSVPPVLALREGVAPHVLDDVRLQKLWLATQRKRWRSLAIVAGSKLVDTLVVAETLAKIAWWYRGQPSCVFDLRDLSLRLVEYQVSEARRQVEAGALVVISLRSIFENPTTVPIAQGAEAVVLCVGLGKTMFADAEATIAEIGRERVIGSIVLRPSKGRRGKNGK